MTLEEAVEHSWWSDFLVARMKAIEAMVVLGKTDRNIQQTLSLNEDQCSILVEAAKIKNAD